MSVETELSPLGVARLITGDALASVLAACELKDESEASDRQLAWELARVARVHGAAWSAPHVFVLVLLVLDAAGRGSTCLRPHTFAETKGRAENLGVHSTLAEEVARLLHGEAVAQASTDELASVQLSLPFATKKEPAGAAALRSEAWGSLPLRADQDSVALARWDALESDIVRRLRLRAALVLPAHAMSARAIVQALSADPLITPRGPLVLTGEQEEAVVHALEERTMVLTGGPGTGKTSIVIAILRALAHRDGAASLAQIALAAPTGKAADRMGEAVRGVLAHHVAQAGDGARLEAEMLVHLRAPTTLHRLLGYRRHDGKFNAHEGNPLSEMRIFVDEASMVDAQLFARWLAAVRIDASLVIMGDPEQLPSVDAGAVLRDLVASGARLMPTFALTKSHRMDPRDPDGAHVLQTARAVRSGALEGSDQGFRRSPAKTFAIGSGGAYFIEVDEDEALQSLVARFAEKHFAFDAFVPLARGLAWDGEQAPEAVMQALARLASVRLLAAVHPTVSSLDAFIAARFARQLARLGIETSRFHARGKTALLPGEPVMVVENDYDEDLWNGDSGVLWRSATGELHVTFARDASGGSSRTKSFASIAHILQRAYVMTVHKAQGSEHDEIMLVLPSRPSALLTREVLYTAITRARKSVAVVGREAFLSAALRQTGTRDTRLARKLGE